jgi:hypothetical protein
VDGQLVEGGFCRSDKVQVYHGDWVVTLDTYVVAPNSRPVWMNSIST